MSTRIKRIAKFLRDLATELESPSNAELRIELSNLRKNFDLVVNQRDEYRREAAKPRVISGDHSDCYTAKQFQELRSSLYMTQEQSELELRKTIQNLEQRVREYDDKLEQFLWSIETDATASASVIEKVRTRINQRKRLPT